jgi:monoamine oxidase
VRTLRAPLDEALCGDLGAVRIPDMHRRVRDLAAAHGLNLIPFESGNGSALVGAGGVVARVPAELERLARALGLRADEAGLSPRALLLRYLGDLPAELDSPTAPADVFARWAELDAQTWPGWLASRGASPGAVALMTVGGDSRLLSALYVLRQFALLKDVGQFFKIQGGMDQLPRAMAAALGSRVRYGVPVVRLARERDAVGVAYLENGAAKTVRARRVVLAVPFSTLREIAIAPPFSADKTRAVIDLPYFPATRFLLQTKTRFWHALGLSGTARTDQPAETWDAAYEQLADRGLIASTVGGELGRAIARMTRADAVTNGVALSVATFPSMRAAFEKGSVYRWAVDPWARGAFAVFTPGQMSGMMPLLARPEGRVHFAGEHTSAWMGWMEGAIESGDRAASEVLTA